MSKAYKAEQRALEAYPVLMCYNDFQMVEEDINKSLREIYQEGYNQAEKDLELTWEDVENIITISYKLDKEEEISGKYAKLMTHYQEVLNRFNKRKGK